MLKELRSLVVETIQEWNKDKAARLAAALAYYTAFSIAPFLIVVIAIVGLIFGADAVRGQIVRQIQGIVGADVAKTIQDLIQSAYHPGTGIPATILGIVTLLLGSLGVFQGLQDALNTVWGTTPKPVYGVRDFIKIRLLSFTLLLGVGFLLIVSLVISTILSAISNYMINLLPGWDVILGVINFLISFAIVTLLFAMMFKYLPDTRIEWRDVWVGAVVTALLFNLGKILIALYLGHTAISSTYGAAGSLVIMLVWVYYSAQILLLGAEFTEVYARHHGSRAWTNLRESLDPPKANATHDKEAPTSPTRELPHTP
jgi:membrane protein